VIAEAYLDQASIFAGIQRFAEDRVQRLACQGELLYAVSKQKLGHTVNDNLGLEYR
jgi:hypothetical protein